MRPHPFCYPRTDVYRNKLDIRDSVELAEAERAFYVVRLSTLPRDIPLTPEGYQAIHRHLLQDLYEWAGEFRNFDMGRTDWFCRPEFVPAQLHKCFAGIRAEDDLRGLAPERFADRAADYLGDLNAVHPFVDGNGRALRSLLSIMGERAGHPVDLARIKPDEWNHASIKSFYDAENSLLAGVIRQTIGPTDRGREEPLTAITRQPAELFRELEQDGPSLDDD